MSEGSGNTNTVQSTTPWAGQQPYLTDVFNQAQNAFQNNPLQYYPGETIAQTTPQQVESLDLQSQRALSGSPVTTAADQYATSVLNGDYLGAGNPYMTQLMGSVGQSIQPEIDSHFEMNGRGGSGANNQAFASAMANEAGSLGFQNYAQERGNQLAVTQMAPELANQDYQDIGNLYNAGAGLQSLGQNYINEDVNRFNFNQQAPYQQIGLYSNLIGQPTGFGTTTQSPYFTNPLGQAMGAASGGLGIYNGLNSAGLLGGGAAAGAGLEGGAGYAALLGGSSGAAAGLGGMSLADMAAAGMIAM